MKDFKCKREMIGDVTKIKNRVAALKLRNNKRT